MPLPVTPSSRRFLNTPRRHRSPDSPDKPVSGLHHADVDSAADGSIRTEGSAPAGRQFAPKPRFGTGKIKRSSDAGRAASPPPSSVVQAFRAARGRTETIDDAGVLHNSADTPEETRREIPQSDAQPEPSWANDLALSPKRRKFHDGRESRDGDVSDVRGAFKHPSSAALAASGATTDSASYDSRKPAFVRPSMSDYASVQPLPEAFSPHRRGHKFVPGGMASKVQQWIIDTGQAAAHSRRGQDGFQGQDYALRVTILELLGGQPFTAIGKMANGELANVLLVVEGVDPNRAQSKTPIVGSVVGVRAPTWKVETEDKQWIVAVDWKVLESMASLA